MAKQDLEKFLSYIGTTWGMLAGITAIFPLADQLFDIIPLPVDGYGKSTEPVALSLTTLTAIFIVYYSFVRRDNIRADYTRGTVAAFVLGLVSLAVYFMLDTFWYPLIHERLCPNLCDSTTDYKMWLVLLIPFYITFFACITRAFTILAIIEFNRKETEKIE